MQDQLINDAILPEETPALIIDRVQLNCVQVKVRDFGNAGCTLVSDRLDEFPDEVMLHIKGIEEMFLSTMVKRGDGSAEVKFQWKDSASTDAREERRIKVFIPVAISNGEGEKSKRAKISEASKSGCRIEMDHVGDLQDDILIDVRGMNAPIRGKIMWRGDKCAGVKLLWNVAGKASRAA